MDFVNQTQFLAGWTLGFEPDGRELMVVAVKGTFLIPDGAEDPSLSQVQVPLTEADEFTGEPGLSATRYESDYAHKKRFCDVLLNGCAYAPGGTPVEEVTVTMQVASMTKSFRVVGNRVWNSGLLSAEPSWPQPFTSLPITYDRAYGGAEIDETQPAKCETYRKNPVGAGYYPLSKGGALNGKPLPNTEELGTRITTPKGSYAPMSFGPVGRNFEHRALFAGTYDDHWLKSRAPFFPRDFDYRYFQAAPPDQQLPYLTGGQSVVLRNLSADGYKAFRIPAIAMPVLFIAGRGRATLSDAAIDTLLIEPDLQRFTLTWRSFLPLRKDCFELRQVVVGKAFAEHRDEQRRPAKPHYSNLEELISAKRARRR
jgi:hypothetical protein